MKQVEFKRILTLPETIIALGIGLVLVILQFFTIAKANAYFINSAYLHLTGFDGTGLGSRLYYTILPLFTALAGGRIYEKDKTDRELDLLYVRSSQRKYLRSSLLVSFITGGLVGVLPLVLEGLCFYAKYSSKPLASSFELLPIAKGGWGHDMFLKHPLMFWLLCLTIVFAYGGMFANLAIITSYFDIRKGVETVVPFLLVLATALARDLLGEEWIGIPSVITPVFSNGYPGTQYAIIGYFVLGMLVVAILTWWKQNDE